MTNFASRLKRIRRDRNLRQVDLANILGLAQTTVANYEQGTRFPDEVILSKIADIFNVSLDFLLARTDIRLNNEEIMYNDTPAENVIPESIELSLFQKEYFHAVLTGNKNLAVQMILDSVKNKYSVKDIYFHVLERSLKEVGRLWEMNILDVSQEHYISNVTKHIMSRLFSYFNFERKNGYSCVSLSVNGEFHNIGISMVTDFLEAEGWDTYYLGSDIPTQNVIRALEDRKADLLAISAAMAFNLDAVTGLIKAVRSSKGCKDVRIMAGGRIFNINKQLWKVVGADGYADTAEKAVTTAEHLASKELIFNSGEE
jgi:MerR family transcriptional regulator, light-induced transcriptional regulator